MTSWIFLVLLYTNANPIPTEVWRGPFDTYRDCERAQTFERQRVPFPEGVVGRVLLPCQVRETS